MTPTISKKLFLGTGSMLVFSLCLGVSAMLSIDAINASLGNIVQRTVKKKSMAQDIEADEAELTGITRGTILRGMINDRPGVERNRKEYQELMRDMQDDIAAIKPLIVSETGRTSTAQVEKSLEQIAPIEDEIIQSLSGGDITKAVKILDSEVVPVQKQMDGAIANLERVSEEQLADGFSQSASAGRRNLWITTLLLLLTSAVGIGMIYIVRQIARVLSSSVLELTGSTEQIAAAAEQVSASSQTLAQSSSEQAATIEETSSASTEINAMARRNTADSHETAQIVTQSQEGIAAANQSLDEMIVAMNDIEASSQKISKIIKVIDEIAFQTNILALNAAVEAARAGQAGAGFSVVADEVRNLAQRCAQAARDTAVLIDESIQNAVGGKTKVDRVALQIRNVTAESAKIKTLIDQINQGSVEQSRGIDQINGAMHQMEQTTQASAANAEQTAAAAQQLNSHASSMRDIVNGLRALVKDGGSNPPSHGSTRGYKARPAAQPRTLSTTIRSVVSFPKTTSHAPAVASGFPLDDDFQEM